MSLVVDASVVIKWFIDEPHHEEARQLLLEREALHAPDLLISEAGNIVWKKLLKNEMTEKQAQSIALSLSDLPVTLHPSTELVERALGIAFAIRHSVYDCLYLACAEKLASRLITADQTLKRKLEQTSLSTTCRVLGDAFDISLSTSTLKNLISLLKQAKATWKSIEGSDATLHLDTPAFRRVRAALQDISEDQQKHLEALRLLGSGSGSKDWAFSQRHAAGGLKPEIDNDLIFLVGQSASIKAGWQDFQKLAKAHSSKK
jgi:predicted nucleic acid-binding protein